MPFGLQGCCFHVIDRFTTEYDGTSSKVSKLREEGNTRKYKYCLRWCLLTFTNRCKVYNFLIYPDFAGGQCSLNLNSLTSHQGRTHSRHHQVSVVFPTAKRETMSSKKQNGPRRLRRDSSAVWPKSRNGSGSSSVSRSSSKRGRDGKGEMTQAKVRDHRKDTLSYTALLKCNGKCRYHGDFRGAFCVIVGPKSEIWGTISLKESSTDFSLIILRISSGNR